MRKSVKAAVLSAAAIGLVAGGVSLAATSRPDPKFSFFITSAGSGKGADLGGLAGADAHCNALAKAAGSTKTGWKAYLSTQGAGGVNARDRIGKGPWYNVNGVMVAKDLAELHGEAPNMQKQTELTEKGTVVNGRGDTPNMHDILTGSNADGTAAAGPGDHTCSNWTSSAETGSANVGHFDRQGGGANPTSWNNAHPSSGCSQAKLVGTGGNGLFFCFLPG
jgi:hypothetical protein